MLLFSGGRGILCLLASVRTPDQHRLVEHLPMLFCGESLQAILQTNVG